MTAFVILAAGPGTRMGRAGDGLHKALVPLERKAVISHQIALAPPDAKVIVVTGHRAGQVRGYLELAHPDREIAYVPAAGWNQPGGGPGASLLAASPEVGHQDMIFTSCDTLWAPDEELWKAEFSWAGIAPIPAGTPPERWCRISSDPHGHAQAVCDKTPGPGEAYTGLSMIKAGDLPVFWDGIAAGAPTERQVTGGLEALIGHGALEVRRLAWTDIGDEAAYTQAVAAWSGYDWAKPDEVTYVLPGQGRVIKYRADQGSLTRRILRQATIATATPPLTGTRANMLAYTYVPGVPAYDAAEDDPLLIVRLLDWAEGKLWRIAAVADPAPACARFYRDKTLERVAMLPPGLRETARHAAARVHWDELVHGCVPVTFHGDFNLGNIIATPDGGFTGIDWREDFAGETTWGDQRYDLGKLVAGLLVHWGNAQRGDFRPWPAGKMHLRALAAWYGGIIPHDIMTIAALSLLNCAPLHAPPLDAVLVARGAAMLEDLHEPG